MPVELLAIPEEVQDKKSHSAFGTCSFEYIFDGATEKNLSTLHGEVPTLYLKMKVFFSGSYIYLLNN